MHDLNLSVTKSTIQMGKGNK